MVKEFNLGCGQNLGDFQVGNDFERHIYYGHKASIAVRMGVPNWLCGEGNNDYIILCERCAYRFGVKW